jgi:hypothetical protein
MKSICENCIHFKKADPFVITFEDGEKRTHGSRNYCTKPHYSLKLVDWEPAIIECSGYKTKA